MYAELTLTSRPEPIPARDDMPDDLESVLVRHMEVYTTPAFWSTPTA